MNSSTPLPRSPLLMSPSDSALLVIDVQEKLVPLVSEHERLIWNIDRLITAAEILEIPVVATEQYPQGLGPTVPRLAARLVAPTAKKPVAKNRFSGGECGTLFRELGDSGVRNVLLAGIETHICVLQTALDLLTAGFEVYLAVDAASTRRPADHRLAIRRMDSAGVTLVSTEMAMFEWCEVAGTPEFKQISQLAKQQAPFE